MLTELNGINNNYYIIIIININHSCSIIIPYTVPIPQN